MSQISLSVTIPQNYSAGAIPSKKFILYLIMAMIAHIILTINYGHMLGKAAMRA